MAESPARPWMNLHQGDGMTTREERLKKVYDPKDTGELMEIYDEWSDTYDRDLEKYDYVGHLNCASQMAAHNPDRGEPVLDAGCGTGLVGEELQSKGFAVLDALDLCDGMLEKAGDKGVYRSRIRADLSKRLNIADNAYGGVTCAGTFTLGHVGPEAFAELARVTRPGGVVCFTIREGAYEKYDYRAEMLRLENEGVWEQIEMRDEDYYTDEVRAKYCAYRVL